MGKRQDREISASVARCSGQNGENKAVFHERGSPGRDQGGFALWPQDLRPLACCSSPAAKGLFPPAWVEAVPAEPSHSSLKGQRRFPARAGQFPVQGRWKVGPCTPLTPGEGPGPEHEPSGARPEELAQLGAASWQREAPASSGSQRGRQRLHARPVEPRLRWWPRRLGVALSALWGDHFRHR